MKRRLGPDPGRHTTWNSGLRGNCGRPHHRRRRTPLVYSAKVIKSRHAAPGEALDTGPSQEIVAGGGCSRDRALTFRSGDASRRTGTSPWRLGGSICFQSRRHPLSSRPEWGTTPPTDLGPRTPALLLSSLHAAQRPGGVVQSHDLPTHIIVVPDLSRGLVSHLEHQVQTGALTCVEEKDTRDLA